MSSSWALWLDGKQGLGVSATCRACDRGSRQKQPAGLQLVVAVQLRLSTRNRFSAGWGQRALFRGIRP